MAARPEEACGEIKFQLRLARKHQIHRLISTRAKTVLGVRLGAAGLSEGLRAARRAAGLRGNGSVTKRSFFYVHLSRWVSTARRRSSRRRTAAFAAWASRRRSSPVGKSISVHEVDGVDDSVISNTGLCGGAPLGGGPRGGGPLGGGPRGGGPRGGPPMMLYARGCPLVPSGCIRSETQATAGYAPLETVPSSSRQRQRRAPAYAPKN